jgi:hypothetical protein
MSSGASSQDLLRSLVCEHGNALLRVDSPEMAAAVAAEATLRAARQATRVIYAVAAEERVGAAAAVLTLRSGGLRLRVAGEVIDEAERLSLARADFDVLVCSVRGLGALLSAAPRLADAVGLVVIEEVDRALDEDGAPWDLALTLLRLAELPPRICGTARGELGAAAMGSLRRWLGVRGASGRVEVQLELAAPAAATPPPLGPIVLALLRSRPISDEGELRRRVLTSLAGFATYEALGAGAKARFTAVLAGVFGDLVAAGSLRRARDGGYVLGSPSRLGRLSPTAPSSAPAPRRLRGRPPTMARACQGVLALG